MKLVRYATIIEKVADGGYDAYVSDLPGCAGMGSTKEEVMQNIAEAIQFHIEGMLQILEDQYAKKSLSHLAVTRR